MTLQEFSAVLVRVYPSVYHYHAGKERGNYVVWHEFGGKRQSGPLTIQRIQVDFFTREEYDPALNSLIAALDAAQVGCAAPKTSYEADTGYIHHILTCEVVDRG